MVAVEVRLRWGAVWKAQLCEVVNENSSAVGSMLEQELNVTEQTGPDEVRFRGADDCGEAALSRGIGTTYIPTM